MFKKKEEKKHEETLLEKMQKSKNQHGIAYINISNDQKVRIDELYMTLTMKYANDDDAFDSIGKLMYSVNESYSRECDYDTLVLNLSIGLLFNGECMDENKQIKPDSEPVNEIVRYYTSTSACYLNNEKVNKLDWSEFRGNQGFINYNNLVKSAEENGLTFNGPKTFEEFKEKILLGESFDISLSASFNSKENEQEESKKYIKSR